VKHWPNFFIVGAPKAGTTSLYLYLKKTPSIYMSPVKEPRYFSPKSAKRSSMSRVKNKNNYLDLFKGVKDEKAIGEASSVYLRDEESPELIKKTIPNAKIIIILRNPIHRAFSHYLMSIIGGRNTKPFSEDLQLFVRSPEKNSRFLRAIIDPGFYYESTKRYVQIFGDANVKIIIFEEFIKNQKEIFREILRFLDVDSELPENMDKVYNEYSKPRNKFMSHIIRKKILRNNILGNNILKIGRHTIKRETRHYIQNRFLNTKDVKPTLTSEEKTTLWEIYQSDVMQLKEFLNRPLPWSAK